ncbi:MAG: beta-N-acetylhexosaminidase [Lachnospiraceae bacterium]|nr:beta-N-acetylhexosaminidase [Lachnospiraceae bacterium]
MGQDNKYIFDIESFDEEEIVQRKETRRKKHKKKRMMSWIFLLLFVFTIIILGYAGVKMLIKGISTKQQAGTEITETVDETGEDTSEIEKLINDEEEVVIAPPEPTEVEPTENDLLEEAIRNYIAKMSLEEKVAGIFIVTPEQVTDVDAAIRAGDGTKAALETYAVGGLIYGAKNMVDKDQFSNMLSKTKEYSKYPLFLAVDEELGNSVFPKEMKVTATMTPKDIGANSDSTVAYLEEEKIANYLVSSNINLNLGIIADPLTDADNELMQNRCFSEDANVSGEMAAKNVNALHEYGVYAGVKFFPGQGSAREDTSNGLSVSTRTADEMRASEFVSFKTAIDAGADMVVVSHISAPNLTGDNTQCSQSKFVMTDLLRNELGYNDVVIITDSLSKAAVSSYLDSKEASIHAIKAGADMVMSPEDFKEAYAGVIEAVNNGVIAKERIDDSLLRIYKVKFKGKSVEEINALVSE